MISRSPPFNRPGAGRISDKGDKYHHGMPASPPSTSRGKTSFARSLWATTRGCGSVPALENGEVQIAGATENCCNARRELQRAHKGLHGKFPRLPLVLAWLETSPAQVPDLGSATQIATGRRTASKQRAFPGDAVSGRDWCLGWGPPCGNLRLRLTGLGSFVLRARESSSRRGRARGGG